MVLWSIDLTRFMSLAVAYISTHLQAIDCADWPKLHGMFESRDAIIRQPRLPVSASGVYLWFINMYSRCSWWRHQMATFSALLALCAGNSPVTGEFPSQRPVTRSFDIFFYLRLNKRLSKQSWRRWFETPSRLLWRHCNGCSYEK